MSKQLLKLTDETTLALGTLQLGMTSAPAARFTADAKPLPPVVLGPRGPQPA